MATARIDMRLDKKIKSKAEKASALLGVKSLTEYIVRLIDEDATRIIEQHNRITVEDDIFDQFINACEKAKKPNQYLTDSVKMAREQGF